MATPTRVLSSVEPASFSNMGAFIIFVIRRRRRKLKVSMTFASRRRRSDRAERSIRVFSFAGEELRAMSGGWRLPSNICSVSDRVFLLDEEDDDVQLALALSLWLRWPHGRPLDHRRGGEHPTGHVGDVLWPLRPVLYIAAANRRLGVTSCL